MDDATIHALNDQEAKKKMMPTASNPRLPPFNLINCILCDLHRLYAAKTAAAGALP
ncbi:hypothetical protein LRM40_11895 [Ideonella dechloratans]|jgi:hypothetical protein|uniref:hypothetical protein n=1 Tax=Pseudomonadota TaxID=1224 RepID=UPI00131451E6|nr:MULTISPECIES: hypothetical protein [Burkholderiales]UFU09013.1 hypothetical protein LRM40_11895 [Ideonella dechloratans]